MRTKKEIMKYVDVTEDGSFEALKLEVLVDTRDQQKKDAEQLRDTLKLVVKAIYSLRGI